MNTQDIVDIVHRLVAFVPDEEDAEDIREDVDAGAFENSVSNLVACLVTDKTPISQADADFLRSILVDLKSTVNHSDRLTIRDQHPDQAN